MTVFSDVVQRFYRLNNPPQPSESLEASQVSYCVSVNNYYNYNKIYLNSQRAFQTNLQLTNATICKL